MKSSDAVTAAALLNAYLPVLLVAFVTTLAAVPLARFIALRYGIIDRPDGSRKVHTMPIAYLGGAAVFVGILAGLLSSSFVALPDDVESGWNGRLGNFGAYAIGLGMTAIFLTGVLDDVFHWDPRLKLAGQLTAAAGLMLADFGTNAVEGLLAPALSQFSNMFDLLATHQGLTRNGSVVTIWNQWSDGLVVMNGAQYAPWMTTEGIYYWCGVVFIAMVVLGASNAANLIDGLDGLLSGSVAIMAVGFVMIAVVLAVVDAREADEDAWLGRGILQRFVETEVPWNTPPEALPGTPSQVEYLAGELLMLDFNQDRILDFEDYRAILATDDLTDIPPALREELGIDISDRSSTQVSIQTGNSAFEEVDQIEIVDGELVHDPNSTLVPTQEALQRYLRNLSAFAPPVDPASGIRLALALALLGGCLGFIPYNFNPAVIFLGDAGSLLLGFLCGVLILSLGSEGQTHYVIAGLIIFALPIMDTLLAILRRKLSGLPMSAPDKNHIHHMTLRAFGSVKKAVFVLYALDAAFVILGVVLALTVAFGAARYLLVYGAAIVIFGMVGTLALKAALRQRWTNQMMERHGSSDPDGAGAESG